jgi:2-polyprenyl-6-methoxyphenol hydroxylase-like FAD-dependent oxidoreductase
LTLALAPHIYRTINYWEVSHAHRTGDGRPPGCGHRRVAGGLFTALLLRKAGWQVDVFERIGDELSGRGAGIVTHDDLFAVLRSAGIGVVPAALGVSVQGRRVLDRSGRVAGELQLGQVLTSWGRLYALLRSSLPNESYRGGVTLRRVEEYPDRVVAECEDGTRIEADLLVGADGLFSTVRRQFLPDIEPRYAGYIAWRGLVDEASLSDATRQTLCDWFAFSLPDGEQMLGYPVAGADEARAAGRRRFNFVWYRPAAPGSALRELLTDVRGEQHPLSIPPNHIRPEVISRMRDDAERLLAPQFAEVVRHKAAVSAGDRRSGDIAHGAQYRRIAVLGDAAFVARPHVGMGVTKAAADAAALAQAIGENPSSLPAALDAFERRRLPYGRAVVRRARELGAYMQSQLLTDRERELARASP